jgi:hypothetical protein
MPSCHRRARDAAKSWIGRFSLALSLGFAKHHPGPCWDRRIEPAEGRVSSRNRPLRCAGRALDRPRRCPTADLRLRLKLPPNRTLISRHASSGFAPHSRRSHRIGLRLKAVLRSAGKDPHAASIDMLFGLGPHRYVSERCRRRQDIVIDPAGELFGAGSPQVGVQAHGKMRKRSGIPTYPLVDDPAVH